MDKVPIRRASVVGRVLTHGRDDDAITQLQRARECQRFCVRGYRDRLISIGVNAPPPESDRRTG
jgi:hypothetical protein